MELQWFKKSLSDTSQFKDGREEELIQFVTSQPELRNSPKGVIAAIDDFGRTQKYMMNIGEDKGRIVCDLIKEKRPGVMVELGGYVGYSAILFGDTLREVGGHKYYTLERDDEFASVISRLVDFAGLKDVVEITNIPSNEGIKMLYDSGKVRHIDMMLLDHYKPAYVSDLKYCESLGMIGKGTVLVADNVITPGNPPYLKYVRSSVEEKKAAKSQEADEASFPQKSAAQYGQVEKTRDDIQGNPNLVYRSRMMESFEPTGDRDAIEITECDGVGLKRLD